jgi:hypothetical protein
MAKLRVLLVLSGLVGLGGCTVYPTGYSGYYGPPAAYVAPAPYYARPYGYGYRPYGYGYRPYGYGYGGRRW